MEDDRALAGLMCRALRRAGCEVRMASTVREGLARAKGCGVVLLDILLPDGNGLEFCDRFRKIAGGEVLLVSSLVDEEEVVRGLNGGGDDYIRKPFSMQELVSRVLASLRRRKTAVSDRAWTWSAGVKSPPPDAVFTPFSAIR